jgi:hypothetical protein
MFAGVILSKSVKQTFQALQAQLNAAQHRGTPSGLERSIFDRL